MTRCGGRVNIPFQQLSIPSSPLRYSLLCGLFSICMRPPLAFSLFYQVSLCQNRFRLFFFPPTCDHKVIGCLWPTRVAWGNAEERERFVLGLFLGNPEGWTSLVWPLLTACWSCRTQWDGWEGYTLSPRNLRNSRL